VIVLILVFLSPSTTGRFTVNILGSLLRVFEKRVLGVFGPERDGVTGGSRKMHSEELRNFTVHRIFLGRSYKGDAIDGACSTH
jgi:hypothetical protein